MPSKGLVLDPKLLAIICPGEDEESEDGDALVVARECQTRVCVMPGVHRKLGEMCGASCRKRCFVVEARRVECGRAGSLASYQYDISIGLHLI